MVKNYTDIYYTSYIQLLLYSKIADGFYNMEIV